MRHWSFLALVATVLGCGGSAASSPGPEGPPPAQEPVVVAPAAPWAELTIDQRRKHMGDHVLPVMESAFVGFDRQRFADFSCETCHGETMVERQFEMPNPDIMPLWATGTPQQQAMVREHREIATFMFNRVVPTMRELLGMPEFDATTGEGFSCYFCHTRGEDRAGNEAAAEEDPDHGAGESGPADATGAS